MVALGTHEEQDHTSLLPFRLVLVENGARREQKIIISKGKLICVDIAHSSWPQCGHVIFEWAYQDT